MNRIVSAGEATDPDTTSDSLQPTFQVKYNQNHLSATGSPIFAKNPTVAKISAGNLACKQDESFHSVCPIVNLDTLSRFSRCERKRDFEMFTFLGTPGSPKSLPHSFERLPMSRHGTYKRGGGGRRLSGGGGNCPSLPPPTPPPTAGRARSRAYSSATPSNMSPQHQTAPSGT